jgi:hypothetical protein
MLYNWSVSAFLPEFAMICNVINNPFCRAFRAALANGGSIFAQDKRGNTILHRAAILKADGLEVLKAAVFEADSSELEQCKNDVRIALLLP